MEKMRVPFLAFVLCTSLVSGCSRGPWLMDASTLTPNPISLVESRYISKKPLSEFSDSDIQEAAKLYARNGAGPLYLVVAYKEDSKGDLTQRTQGFARTLQNQGIAAADIVASTVPLETDAPVALIAFDTLEAAAPEGCTDIMPGLDNAPGKPSDLKYKLGCTVKGYMARQIAKPSDLKGVAGIGGTNDGERAANIVNGTLKPGAPREFLPSYVISTLAGTGG